MKEFIQNRKGQKIAVIVEKAEPQKGLAFVMHGLGGFKEQPHIKTIADAFKDNGYTVVRFDTTNTIGESDGKYEDATATNYYEDLEYVIKWSENQNWFQEPFILVGHSFGGLCTALFAQNHPKRVKALAPASPTVSGRLSMESHEQRDPEEFKKWRETGWLVTESKSKPGVMKRLKWSNMEDRLKYDLLPEAKKLVMPVLVISGEKEDELPVHRLFYDSLPAVKEFYVIKEAPHTYLEPEHLAELKVIFDKWIKSLK